MIKKWGTGTVDIPAPMEIDEIMSKIPKGKHNNKRNSLLLGKETQRNNRLPYYYRLLCLDRGKRCGRKKTERLQEHNPLLAHFENWRLLERKISRRSRNEKGTR